MAGIDAVRILKYCSHVSRQVIEHMHANLLNWRSTIKQQARICRLRHYILFTIIKYYCDPAILVENYHVQRAASVNPISDNKDESYTSQSALDDK